MASTAVDLERSSTPSDKVPMNRFTISVIIPAHNAASTIAKTLESLQAQTDPQWEVIVIDDGSTDETNAIATQMAANDSRIRIVQQKQQGVSTARNIGIDLARSSWLLFLDADDWISPDYLETMTATINADANLDAVCCGWVQIAFDGTEINRKQAPTINKLFEISSQHCPFIIHACLIRREVVLSVGGFNAARQTCEDWDLWQRIARSTARFGSVNKVMAFYRMQSGSLSRKGLQLFKDAMQVIEQGHLLDSRVPNSQPQFLNGQPVEQLSLKKLYFVSWLAGLFLEQGSNPQCLLTSIEKSIDRVDFAVIATCLIEGILTSACQPPKGSLKIWLSIEESLQFFLLALEERVQLPGLARQVKTYLERLIAEQTKITEPLTIGTTYAVRIEITTPIANILAPINAERLYAVIELEGTRLGIVELPICDHQVDREVLVDAIAAQFFWVILGRFFEQTYYCQISEVERQTYHDQNGWTIFLRELWNRPNWSSSELYDPMLQEGAVQRIHVTDPWCAIEVSAELPEIETKHPSLQVVITVGGLAIGSIEVPVEQNLISAQGLRCAVMLEAGIELCIASVREALIGNCLTDSSSLRQRLTEAAQNRKSGQDKAQFFASRSFPDSSLVISRYLAPIATSVSRRATLPVSVAPLFLETSAIASFNYSSIDRVIYAPDLIAYASQQSLSFQTDQNLPASSAFNARNHFETLFAAQPDPWKYTSPYEQLKYEQTLSLLPKAKFERALELACAEGHFTVQLAPYVKQLSATDISQIALDRAMNRCTGLNNIHFMRLDLSQDPIPGPFPLIICSEVLYYLEDHAALRAFAHKITEALEPGGYFLHAHANLVVDEPDRAGFSWDHPFGAKGIADAFAQVNSLDLVKEIHTPLYRIQLFQRRPRIQLLPRRLSQIIELPQPTAPPDRVAASILWQGGQPYRNPTQTVTHHLPILMYHRIAATGSAKLDQWRVTPQTFAEQLSYLQDAGYYSISLETWYRAVLSNTPLSGRAIILTFDDGYEDFLEAWTVLKQHSFSATVFLAADYVGRSNLWDQPYSEALPLLNWQQIKHLQSEGVEFGSHSLSHRPLTALSPTEVVEEGVRSRSILEQQLDCPVRAFAYPYGNNDAITQHLIGACGYTFGLSYRSGFARFRDSLMALPRIEITGSDTLESFITKISFNH